MIVQYVKTGKRQTCSGGNRPIARRWLQSARQSTRIVTMIIYQIGNGFTTMLFWQVILISAILFNMIMFDMRLRAVNIHKIIINIEPFYRSQWLMSTQFEIILTLWYVATVCRDLLSMIFLQRNNLLYHLVWVMILHADATYHQHTICNER